MNEAWTIYCGNAVDQIQQLPAGDSESGVACCVTSPPYWGLRDYGHEGQIGLEETPEEYVERLVDVFREVRRVLRDDGTLWVNVGDTYNAQPGQRKATNKPGAKQTSNAGSIAVPSRTVSQLKPKDLVGIPWRVAFALQADGWYLRQDIIWQKPNPMPESVKDRCTKAHEYIFLLSKSQKYYWDYEAMQEPSTGLAPGNKNHKYTNAYEGGDEKHRTKAGLLRYSFARREATPPGQKPQKREGRENRQYDGPTRNMRSVWGIATLPTPEAHFATFPIELPERCLLAGSRVGDLVLDPFSGAGTTGLAALKHGRRYLGVELNPEYIEISEQRRKKYFSLFV